MPNISELHDMYLHQLDAVFAESELLLQREGGLDGELKTSGYICEQFVKNTMERFIVPGQFRLTSGFIATPELLTTKANLPQCDILIVDRNTPPILRFEKSEIEVVAAESVCGIIEVKRSLTKESLHMPSDTGASGALAHLSKIVKKIAPAGNFKTDTDLNLGNMAVGYHNHSSNKPLVGIVSLNSNLNDFGSTVANAITSSDSLVDFVWSLDGHAVIPGFGVQGDYNPYSHTARPLTKTWSKLQLADFHGASSPFYHIFDKPPTWIYFGDNTGFNRSIVFSRLIGIVTMMLSRVCSRPLKEEGINSYYFSHY